MNNVVYFSVINSSLDGKELLFLKISYLHQNDSISITANFSGRKTQTKYSIFKRGNIKVDSKIENYFHGKFKKT